MVILPVTKLGKFCLYFGISAIIMFLVVVILSVAGQTGGNKFNDNYFLAIPAFLSGLSILAAGLIALTAFFKSSERALIIYPIIFIFLLFIFFAIGEFAVQH